MANLISLMDSPSLKVQCQAALALRNLASDGACLVWVGTGADPRAEKYQLEIVKHGGLPPLLRLLRSSFLPLILSAAACVRNVSIHPSNESPIIDSGFLHPLIDLLAYDENEEIQCHAISTLRNLAASSEGNKRAIVEAGAAERIKELVLSVPVTVQSEMTACAAVLGLSGALRFPLLDGTGLTRREEDIKSQLLDMGICEVLIPLTASPSVEVQGNSAAALGNLSSKSESILLLQRETILTRSPADDYSAFSRVWTEPEGGLHGYLVRFLESRDTTFQHIAIWTLVQLLESGDPTLEAQIRASSTLIPLATQLSTLASSSASNAPPSSHRADSDDGTTDGEGGDGGEGEIRVLAKRVLELLEGETD